MLVASGVIVAEDDASVFNIGALPLLKKISKVSVSTKGVLAFLEEFKGSGGATSGVAEGVAPEALIAAAVEIDGLVVVAPGGEATGTFLNNKTLGASRSTLSSKPLIPTKGE